ncbi:ABC transporter ATP-binding protein [Candidatus Venteria ishoeyi]|uniref:Putative phospholipid import ATP-binding protein MlaF n=1 Tax=Candidatus Venteria ishoeyi TaxID=1899563 RepID=A0A1H6FEI1_9GAMM|nr:ATP-binding cassette domain-containing protein [Candidatus Venteria ishoeyi]MDM8546445.1 ATP-binding cassette domain-containing protein [Candidatus Venteria ishoeyi]SEH08488.1 putative phospholipid import ATP-binding protein MlaF [Candidatus Venteria ishoeyi]
MTYETVISLRNIKTHFGEHCVHQNLNLDIHRSEVLALIGGSGTGKTTLLREMILLEYPQQGSIRVFDREILGMAEHQVRWLRERCGVMFQNGALFSSLTVLENVMIPLHEHSQLSEKTMREIAMLKIRLAGLERTAAYKYPAQLSGGMIKRAALARALALDPEILFLDEPSAGLDPIGAGALDQLILEIKRLLGLTIVLVTHDLDSLWTVTDRVAVLAEKKVVAVDSMQVLSGSQHPWIRQYLHGIRGIRFNEG